MTLGVNRAASEGQPELPLRRMGAFIGFKGWDALGFPLLGYNLDTSPYLRTGALSLR
jgi:hypothetical protein